MNNLLEDKLLDLKDELYNSDEVQNFLKLKHQIENDKYINKLKSDIKDYQMELVRLNKENSTLVNKTKEEYLKLLNEYRSNPIVVMYETSFEEVSSLIFNIKDIIEF